MATAILTPDALRSVIRYDEKTGVFTRLVRLAQRHHAGDRADTLITAPLMYGYRRVSLFSQRYLAHRLAWFYTHGVWPKQHIDHINGDKGDNRIENLREVDDRLNLENLRSPKATNLLGVLGVHVIPNGRIRARIQVRGKSVHLGLFDTLEDAQQAYLIAKRKLHEGCTI